MSPKELEIGKGQGRELQPKSEEALAQTQKRKLTYDVISVTNHGAGGRLQARRLTPTERACGCMSNGIDGQGGDKWPKVERAIQDFSAILKTGPTCGPQISSENELVENLFNILTYVYAISSDMMVVC